MALEGSSKYSKITMGDREFRYLPYTYGSVVKNTNLEILAEGKYTLLEKHRVDLEPAQKAAAYKDAKPPNFRRMKSDFFVMSGSGPATAFHNAKDLAEQCNMDDTALKAYIKKNKIKIKDRDSLVKLFSYINSQ